MLPFVLMAQLNSEKLSQGCHSLQYFRLSAKANMAAQSVSFQVNSSCGSAQIDFLSKRDCLSAAGRDRSFGADCSAGKLRNYLFPLPGRLKYSRMMTEAASAAFVARASDTPPRGVLGV